MTHPYLRLLADILQKGPLFLLMQQSASILPFVAVGYASPELFGRQLSAITNAQHWYPAVQRGNIHLGCILVVYRKGRSG